MGTRKELIKIYNLLLEEFGSRGWWPLYNPKTQEIEYHQQIKQFKHKLEIIIGSILTQNTSWKNVEKAVINLNKEKLVDLKNIKKVNITKLKKLIRPAGYFNQKASRLKILSNFLEKNHNPCREELLQVKGIGPETADSILLYAFNKPYFVIDAYTKRIFSRLGFSFKTYEELQSFFMNNLNKNYKLFNEYHALLVELGKNYCTKNNPFCQECPLLKACKFGQKLTVS